jgi:hypothetical protein
MSQDQIPIKVCEALVEALQLGLDAMNTLDYKATPANRAFVVAAREALRAAGVEPRA